MAEKKTIELEVKSNIEGSISELKALKRQLKDTAAGSAEFKQIYNQIDDLEDKIKSAKNTSSDWVDSLENAGGPLGALGAGINKAKVATQTFGGALKATGIGLVVALLAGLAGAFSENEGAMKKLQPLLNGLQKLFQGVFRVVEPLFNTLVDMAINALPMVSKAFEVVYSSVTAVFQSLGSLGSALKKLISGDFSGAWKDAKESVTGFSKHYDKSVENFQKGTKEMTKTEKEEAEKRAEERKKAQKEREDKEKAARDKKLADEKAANLKLLEEQRAFDLETLKGQQEKNLQKVQQEIQDTLDEKNRLQSQQEETSAAIDKLDADNATKEKITSEQKINAKKNTEEAIYSVAKNGQDLILALQDAGIAKGKAGQTALKALALVQIGIDTAQAFSNAVPMAIKAGAEAAKIAGPAAPFVGPLATAASYLSSATMIAGNIAKAKKLLGSGGGVTTPSISSAGGGAGSAPAAPQFNVVGASSTNQLAQSIGQNQNQPIKAYVVAGDVTTQQGLTRNIVNTATIG